MLDRDPDAGVENDRIVNVPAIGLGVAAHDAPLVGVRAAVVGRVAGPQPPGHQEIILRPRAPDGGGFLAVNINFLVALAEPFGAAGAHGQDGADVVALALCVKYKIILAVLDRVFLAVLGVKVRRVARQRFLLDPINIVVEQADRLLALVDDFDAGRFAERHGPETIVSGAVGDDHRQADDLVALAETTGEEIAHRRLHRRAGVAVPKDAQEHFLVVGGADFGPILLFRAEESHPDVVDHARPLLHRAGRGYGRGRRGSCPSCSFRWCRREADSWERAFPRPCGGLRPRAWWRWSAWNGRPLAYPGLPAGRRARRRRGGQLQHRAEGDSRQAAGRTR